MPPRRVTVCTTPGCPQLTDGGPCPNHRPRPSPQPDRPSTATRGYGAAHQTIAAQLRRLHPHGPCARCGQPGDWNHPDDPLTAGHIDHDGPTVLANYQPEHRSCGTAERNRRRRRPDDHTA